jgi:L-arabinose isomerase
LYGAETLKQVDRDSETIAKAFDELPEMPVRFIFKPVVTTPEEICRICLEANNAPDCIGLVTWMHTFSPAKMWIQGLTVLNKPFAHLHTQFNRDIPWKEIDMDFMNLNQSAHGDREFGFICSRMRLERKVIVGHWQDEKVRRKLAVWVRAAIGYHASRSLKYAVLAIICVMLRSQREIRWKLNGYWAGRSIAWGRRACGRYGDHF